MELKFKFNSCDEAHLHWDESWHRCPVCGEPTEIVQGINGEELLIAVHKPLELLVN